jgi:PAS domain S-box-containing protein
MSESPLTPEHLSALEEELESLKKINRALMNRVERSTDSAGNAFSLFETSILLQQRVNERTQDLQQTNTKLQAEISERRQAEFELRKSQRQTRLIIDTALDAVIAFDRRWNILDWNPRAEATFGYPADFAVDRLNLATLIASGGHDLLSQYLTERAAATEGEQPHTLELTARHSDGHEFPIELAVSVLSAGEPVVFSAFIRDITERKQAEEARYRTLFDNSPISLHEQDYSVIKKYLDKVRAQGITDLRDYFERYPEALEHCASAVRIIDCNLATVKLFAARDKQHFSENYVRIFEGGGLSLFADALVTLFAGKATFESEAALRTLTGEPVYIIVNLSLAPGHHESWSKVFISVMDATDRHRAEDEKNKLEMQLRHSQKMETIGTLAGGIAHDFNNMLSPILGYADIIAQSADDETTTREAVEHVIAAAHRARDLVRQILTFSRQVENELKPVQLQPLIKEALDLIRASLPSSVSIHPQLEHSTRLVMADPTQIHQIILNLCTNAYHALENASGSIEVVLSNVTVDESLQFRHPRLKIGPYVRLTVSDGGCGIEEANLERIFEPFFTTKRVGEGTGMGLAVTHGIVQKHGGEIVVESVRGQGSSFHVYLPASANQIHADSRGNPLAFGTERVLVVDDEPMVAGITHRLLERMGYTVTTVNNPLDALNLFRSAPQAFDAVLTDQTMPQLPGHQLAQELSRIRADIPIVLLTGYSQVVTDSNLKSYGISELVMKPASASDLSHALRRALDSIRM